MKTYVWSGRQDGDGQEHQRYHHLLAASGQAAEFTLIGFACDEGVLRNGGRAGASEAPAAIRAALANMVPVGSPSVRDAGDVESAHDELDAAHGELAYAVAAALESGSTPIVLGGGHEVAFGSFSGLLKHQQHNREEIPRIGIINLDAHFDLRGDELPSSGTPFLQAARACRATGVAFHYMVLGIAQHANTQALFQTAERLKVRFIQDTDLQLGNIDLPAVLARIDDYLATLDAIYLSVDMDVFPAAVAPGVSAPAPRGVPREIVETLFRHIVASGKVRVFDVAETNPRLDVDQRTAKLAALLVHEFISA